jgi:aminoglycoside/choline kinase family phosphotransferase
VPLVPIACTKVLHILSFAQDPCRDVAGDAVTPLHADIAAYERWLRKQCTVVERDLQLKHERTRKSAFDFLRASYFHWARTIEQICPDLAHAPKALCVGDTHVENFGTWRDAQARLVWGINDFDEATTMPYPLIWCVW